MQPNQVVTCTLMIRGQSEDGLAANAMSVRRVVEMPAICQQQSHINVEALLTFLSDELMELQKQTVAQSPKEGRS